jgi:hypothetical protein
LAALFDPDFIYDGQIGDGSYVLGDILSKLVDPRLSELRYFLLLRYHKIQIREKAGYQGGG